MPQTDLPAALARLKALCAAATPGPLDVHKSRYDLTLGGHRIVAPRNGEHPPIAYCMDAIDADFIAAARTALPALLDTLEALLAEFPEGHVDPCPKVFGYDHMKCRCSRDAVDAALKRLEEWLR